MALYPVGQQDFKGIIEGGYTYVDKTSYITEILEEKGKYYFLSRPRRFGKSLFLSTLGYFFKGRKELFEGLAISDYKWDWEEYPVIQIDLNGADFTEKEEALKIKLGEQLKYVEKEYDIIQDTPEVRSRFEKLIVSLYEKYHRQVVVLVDEYEKPVLDTVSQPEISNRHKETLRGFYGVLKSLDKYIKLVFLTGVTKFGKMSVFSALNNINDISLDIKYGAVCGITKEELVENFHEGIENLAAVEGVGYDEALELLRVNYDGYHFNRECPDLYNPFSIICALSKSEIRPYWFATGTPNILVDLLLRKKYNIRQLEGVTATASRLMDMGNEFEDPVSLFYQTGYLTIKSYDKTMKLYTLGFPNQEVELAFIDFLMPNFLITESPKPESFVLDFARGINNGDPEMAFKALEAFSADINYELVQTPEVERHFQNLLYLFGRMILPYTTEIKTEERTSDGRIDLLIKTEKYIYVIEIKRDSSAESALQQIKDKDYSLKFSSDPRKVFLVGVNFSTEKKRIDGFRALCL